MAPRVCTSVQYLTPNKTLEAPWARKCTLGARSQVSEEGLYPQIQHDVHNKVFFRPYSFIPLPHRSSSSLMYGALMRKRCSDAAAFFLTPSLGWDVRSRTAGRTAGMVSLLMSLETAWGGEEEELIEYDWKIVRHCRDAE